MATRIKKNDTVIIKTGKDKGKEGKVILAVSYTHLTLPTTPYV